MEKIGLVIRNEKSLLLVPWHSIVAVELAA
jgi:hypothetical protein